MGLGWGIQTVIHLPPHNAYSGASCQIVADGDWFVKDDRAEPICYRGKKIPAAELGRVKIANVYRFSNGSYRDDEGNAYYKAFKFPQTKRVASGKTPREVGRQEFGLIRLPSVLGGGLELKKFNQLQNAKHLKLFGIEMPAGTSHFLAGLFAQFEEAYKGWLDVKRPNNHKPRYRHIDRRDEWVRSIYSNQMRSSAQYGCTAAPIEFIRGEDEDYLRVGSIFGDFVLYKGEYDRVPKEMIPRSYSIVNDASGYYATIVFATRAEVESVLAASQLKRAGKNVPEEVKIPLKQAVTKAKQAVKDENYEPGNGKILGVDPGVVRQITGYDGRKTFHIKLAKSRQQANQRLSNRVDRLKSKLSRMKNTNNLRFGLDKDTRRSAGEIKVEGRTIILKNELQLAQKIARKQLLRANRRNAYQHRVAVRLFSEGYSEIRYERTEVKTMMAAAEPKLGSDGKYLGNKAKEKRKLNKSIGDTAMAAQAAKIKLRFTTAGRNFVEKPSPHTTTACHCCGQKGVVGTDRLFRCLNVKCDMHEMLQDIDDNAAKNIWAGSPAPDTVEGKSS